jgi:hypothetical protein
MGYQSSAQGSYYSLLPFATHCFQCTLKSKLAIDLDITFS